MKLYTILRNLIQSIKNALQEAKDYSDARGDYIVEEGTSGIWTYRKWASGIAECWGQTTVTGSVSRAWGGGYISDNVVGHNFPFTFTELQYSTVSVRGQNSWIMGGADASNTKAQDCYIYRETIITGTATHRLDYSAKGLWKAFENVGGVILNLLNRRVVVA